MSDYSKSPLDFLLESQKKGYVGIHIEQGVPLLDRDLNLLHDLIGATVRSVITRYIGNGVPAGSGGFAIQASAVPDNNNDFRIAAGACLVAGIEVTIPIFKRFTTYKLQPSPPPALTTPSDPQPDPRTDVVYLDVFFTEVDAIADPDLSNSVDVGMQTSVRLKSAWVVRVAEGIPIPADAPREAIIGSFLLDKAQPPPGHVYYPLALLRRPQGTDTIAPEMITDLRQSRLTVSAMEQRLSLLEKLLLLPAFVTQPLPQFLPKSGIINQVIRLNGTNFDVGTVQVRFDSVPAVIVGLPSPTEIAVRVPPGLTPAGTRADVKITVSNPGGSDISEDAFTVRADPAFADPGRQFTPPQGTPGQQVTLNGFNFNAGNVQVQFGTTSATLVGAPTANQIVVEVPIGLVPIGSTTADVNVKVTTTAGTVTSDDNFRAETNRPAPLFAAPPNQFKPPTGRAGDVITLNGQNFNLMPVSVKFDTITATVSGSPSSTQIAVIVPPGIVPAGGKKGVQITVTTGGGSAVSTDTFQVTG